MHFLHVVGARPNFMKVAPVMRALAARQGVRQTLVHTGQHYDQNMSDVFFRELEIPEPDFNLAVGSGTHAEQTGQIMLRFEPVVVEQKPDWVLVYGDVNSTIAAALVCAKLQIPVAHVEAGLRSFDRSMPEEINRLLTDQSPICCLRPLKMEIKTCFVKECRESAFTSSGMLWSTLWCACYQRLRPHCPRGLPEHYALVTLHRPSNVDDLCGLKRLLDALTAIGTTLPDHFSCAPQDAAKNCRIRLSSFREPAALGTAVLPPVPGFAAEGNGRHHRLWWNSGGDYLPGCAMFDTSRHYGTPGYGDRGDERHHRPRHESPPSRSERRSQWRTKERSYPPSLGRPGRGEDCPDPRNDGIEHPRVQSARDARLSAKILAEKYCYARIESAGNLCECIAMP